MKENRFTLYVLIKKYKKDCQTVYKPITFSLNENYVFAKKEQLRNKVEGEYSVYLMEVEETKFNKYPLSYINMLLDELYGSDIHVPYDEDDNIPCDNYDEVFGDEDEI